MQERVGGGLGKAGADVGSKSRQNEKIGKNQLQDFRIE